MISELNRLPIRIIAPLSGATIAMRSNPQTYGSLLRRTKIQMPNIMPIVAPWLAMPPSRMSVMMRHGSGR